MKFENVKKLIRNDWYYVEKLFTLLVSGWCVRSINCSSFAYGFLTGIGWNWVHTSCENIRWESESNILELSENFQENGEMATRVAIYR